MKKDKPKDKELKKKKKPLVKLKPEEEKRKEIRKKNKKRNPFIQVDWDGNILSNFFSNFIRQLRNPTKTGLSRILDKLLVIKIDKSENKPKQAEPLDIMGPAKTVFRYVKNISNDNLTPSEKESLRQRTNQTVKISTEQNKDEQINKTSKKRLGM